MLKHGKHSTGMITKYLQEPHNNPSGFASPGMQIASLRCFEDYLNTYLEDVNTLKRNSEELRLDFFSLLINPVLYNEENKM